jgi:hydrogenase/urease accessory protein HupE
MKHSSTTLRAAAAAALVLAAGAAGAHTGHGHDGLSFMQGLRHALGEPDHLLMLAFGFGITSLAAPRVWAAGRRVLLALRARAQARRAAAIR